MKINNFTTVIYIPCVVLLMCTFLFTIFLWWTSKIIIQITYPFVLIFCKLLGSITRLNTNTILLNILTKEWKLRTQICQALNAEMWKIRIFSSALFSDTIAIRDLLELKREIVDSQNSIIAFNHTINTSDSNDIDYFTIKINLAIEQAEIKSLKNIYKLRSTYLANKFGISEDYIHRRVDVELANSISNSKN